jgi:hypothetical protein
MTRQPGQTPPLHRLFDEHKSIGTIRERYRKLQPRIGKQVSLLQNDQRFRSLCAVYYNDGYKDWHILLAIYNCMMNWSISVSDTTYDPERIAEEFKRESAKLDLPVFPPDQFTKDIMDFHFDIQPFTSLNSYGFEPRRVGLKADVVRKFLRERMRHYDLDIPHMPLFGEPPGEWPR